MRMTSTSRWIGCSSARIGSRTGSPAVTFGMGRWCSTTCPRATSRDGRVRWRNWGTPATASAALPQIIYGLLCDTDGRPVAVEVFTGELHDDKTLPSQVNEAEGPLRAFPDRGRRGSRDGHQGEHRAARGGLGVDWITALKAPTIKKLARSGIFQPSLFDEQNLGEITDVAEFPGERLVVCRNPLVGAQRARTREELLAATETDLAQIAHRVNHGTLQAPIRSGWRSARH